MIQEVTMYTVICDNCVADVNEGAEYSCWNDKDFAGQIADESGYIREGDKHYCPSCVSWNDDDELVIDKSRTKTSKL